jgi:hypothetical protein
LPKYSQLDVTYLTALTKFMGSADITNLKDKRMKSMLKKAITSTAASVSIASLITTTPAQAASFIPFSFKTNVTASPSNNPSETLVKPEFCHFEFLIYITDGFY